MKKDEWITYFTLLLNNNFIPLQGYARTDSTDAILAQPPPYTPTAGDPLPIIYQLTSSQSAPDIHARSSPIGPAALPSVHRYQSPARREPGSDHSRRGRTSTSLTSQGHGQGREGREGRRPRTRHRRRRSRGLILSSSTGSEDQSALITPDQDPPTSCEPPAQEIENPTALPASLHEFPNPSQNTQPDLNLLSQPDSMTSSPSENNSQSDQQRDLTDFQHSPQGALTTDNCDSNLLVGNSNLNSTGNEELIELGQRPRTCDPDAIDMTLDDPGLTLEDGEELTVTLADPEPDRATLESGSGSWFSGGDSASGCSSFLDQSSMNSLPKSIASSSGGGYPGYKSHRRSVSAVSAISKTSIEPSVSKVEEEDGIWTENIKPSKSDPVLNADPDSQIKSIGGGPLLRGKVRSKAGSSSDVGQQSSTNSLYSTGSSEFHLASDEGGESREETVDLEEPGSQSASFA